VTLGTILERKRSDVAQRMRERPLDRLRAELAPSDRAFVAALRRPHTGFVLEHKRASPSQGAIRLDLAPALVARAYAPYADAISVLTDEPFFDGRLEHLAAVRSAAPQPVLCKDFVIDPYQVYEARRFGADAILLMASVLDDPGLSACLQATRELSMGALCEVHDEAELGRVLRLGGEVIGVNNRDLRTMRVDLTTSERLAPLVPQRCVRVCESGIESHAQVRRLRDRFDAFLVGTSLMRAPELAAAVRALVFGRVKVCGLRRTDQARAALDAGASFGGLVLWDGSPRAIDREAAAALRSVPLAWVGVFVDEAPERVAAIAHEVELAAVQLHGSEGRGYLERLRAALPSGVAIWKAVRVGPATTLPARDAIGADRLLLDTFVAGKPGGTGERFDWRPLDAHHDRAELIVGGGLSPDNAAAADALDVWALDVSSGVERAPGDKDPARLAAFFGALRGNLL